MVAIAGIMPLGGLLVPVVVLETVTETSTRAPDSGDRVDLLTAHLLGDAIDLRFDGLQLGLGLLGLGFGFGGGRGPGNAGQDDQDSTEHQAADAR